MKTGIGMMLGDGNMKAGNLCGYIVDENSPYWLLGTASTTTLLVKPEVIKNDRYSFVLIISRAHCGYLSNVSIFGSISKNGNINISIFGNVSKNGNGSSQKMRNKKSFFHQRY